MSNNPSPGFSPRPDQREPDIGGVFRAGAPLGFPLRIHWSWLIAFVLVSWTIATGFLPAAYPEWTTRQFWSAGIIVSLLFFGSVLAHELAHAVVARRRGYQIKHITLMVFGGASALAEEPRNGRDEFWIAIVGPLSSLLLAVGFGAALFAGQALGVESIVPIAAYLALINAVLAVFNMLPGFPLDGGRVLRAAVWSRRGDMLSATRIASAAGRVVAALLVLAGLWYVSIGASLNGFWLMMIAWFLWSAAGASYQHLLLQTSLQGLPVGSLVEREIPHVSPLLTLREMAEEYVIGRGKPAVFVSPTEEGGVMGIVTLAELQRVPQTEWDRVTVYRAMTPADQMLAVPAQADALEVLALMARHRVSHVPVLYGRDVLGVVTQRGINTAIQLRSAFRPAPPAERPAA